MSLRRIPGTLRKLTSALGAAGALVDAIDIIEHQGDVIVVETRGEAHGREVVQAARAVSGVQPLSVSDRVFDRNLGGKVEVTPKFPVLTRDDLAMAYTPGVGRVCSAIAAQTQLVWDYTIKSGAVALAASGCDRETIQGFGKVDLGWRVDRSGFWCDAWLDDDRAWSVHRAVRVGGAHRACLDRMVVVGAAPYRPS